MRFLIFFVFLTLVGCTTKEKVETLTMPAERGEIEVCETDGVRRLAISIQIPGEVLRNKKLPRNTVIKAVFDDRLMAIDVECDECSPKVQLDSFYVATVYHRRTFREMAWVANPDCLNYYLYLKPKKRENVFVLKQMLLKEPTLLVVDIVVQGTD